MTHSLVSYRAAISAVIRELRPQLEIFTVEPEDLDKEFVRLSPHFVICSRVTDLVEREALGWIELYPKHASESVVSFCGEKVIYLNIDLDTLLSVLDEAERLYENA